MKSSQPLTTSDATLLSAHNKYAFWIMRRTHNDRIRASKYTIQHLILCLGQFSKCYYYNSSVPIIRWKTLDAKSVFCPRPLKFLSQVHFSCHAINVFFVYPIKLTFHNGRKELLCQPSSNVADLIWNHADCGAYSILVTINAGVHVAFPRSLSTLFHSTLRLCSPLFNVVQVLAHSLELD